MISNMIAWIACFNSALLFFFGDYFTANLPKPTVRNDAKKQQRQIRTIFSLAPLNQVGLPGMVCCINSLLNTWDILDTSYRGIQPLIQSGLHYRGPQPLYAGVWISSKGFGCWLQSLLGHPGCWFKTGHATIQLFTFTMCCNDIMLFALRMCLCTVSI